MFDLGDIIFVRCKHPSGVEEKTFGHIGVVTALGCNDYEVDNQYWYTAKELRLAKDDEIRHAFKMLKMYGKTR